MAEGRGIIAYAVNSADLCAPWRQEVRWRWVPAAVIAIGALLVMDVLEAVASKWRWDSHVSMIFHQGALGFYPRVLVALFLALIVKRCGWLRVVVGIAVAGLLIAATFLKRPTIFHDNTLHAATLAGGFLAGRSARLWCRRRS